MPRSASLNDFGRAVEDARRRSGLSNQGLADRLGISRKTIWRHLTGRSSPSMTEFRRYAEVLRLDLGVLGATNRGNAVDTDEAPSAVSEEGPTYGGQQLEDFVSNLDKVVRLLSTGEGVRMGPKSKLAIMNGIEEAARLAGQKLPAEFYDLRRRINEGTL